MANQKENNQVRQFGESDWVLLPPELYEQIIAELERQEREEATERALISHKKQMKYVLDNLVKVCQMREYRKYDTSESDKEKEFLEGLPCGRLAY